MAGYLLGLACIVGVLLDVGRHLLHGGGSLLGRRRLLRGARRQLLGAGRHFLAARGDVAGGIQRIAHHAPKLFDHAVKRGNKILDFVVALDLTLLVQIASGDGVSEGHRAIKPAADAERHPDPGRRADQQHCRDGCQQQLTRAVVLVGGLFLRLLHDLLIKLDDASDTALHLVGQRASLFFREVLFASSRASWSDAPRLESSRILS